MDIRTLLEMEMRRRGWTQSALARKIGVKQQLVSRWMDEDATKPSAESCRLIAVGLELPVNTVLKVAGYPVDVEPSEAPSDPELDVWLREVAEIYQSFERSKWRDLTATFRGVASLSSPSPKDNAGGTPQSSLAEITLEEPELTHPAKAVNYDRAKEAPRKRELVTV